MIFSKEQHENIKKLHDSVHDSDALAKLAYEFAQMGNYFDRANSAHSREILGKEDEAKYKEFLRKGIQVKAQLQKEVAAMNAAQIDPSKKPKGLFAKEDDTNRLLRDGIHLLYWAADNMRDQTGIKLSKELDKLFDDYFKNKMFGTKDSKPKDSKVKDSSPDVEHIADYLWTWNSDSAGGWNAYVTIEEYITPETLTEENLKKGVTAAEKELDKVYSQLQTIVNKKLKEGYAKQKNKIKQMTDWYRKHEKYQG